MKLRTFSLLLAPLAICSVAAAAKPTATSPDGIAVLRTASAESDQVALAAAFKQVTQRPVTALPTILHNMQGVSILGENWFRAAVDTIAERELAGGGKLPAAELEEFLLDRDQSPRARRIAFEWLERVDDTARARLIPTMLDDPSLELRREAVTAEIDRAKVLEGEQAATAYKIAFAAARDLDQIKDCAAALKKLDQPADMVQQLGFVTDWRLIGIFDNKDRTGYAKVFPPETEINPDAKYEGRDKQVGWIEHHTDHEEGEVDFNKAYGEIKEVLAYAAGEIHVDRPRDAQIRLNCITACKVWLNGQLVLDHEVYHAGYKFDQYIADVKLKAGRNTLLVKVCQNEQTESWTNVWKFALRVCDKLGGGIRDEG
jgi:hypothetical protein